jgi:hypothetical protein
MMEVADLAFLVDAEADSRLPGRPQAFLHRLQVELILVEHPRQRAELVDSAAPRLVRTEPALGGRRRPFALEGRQQQHLHDAAPVIVAAGPEAVGDLVEPAPRVHVGEHRKEVAIHELGVGERVHVGLVQDRAERAAGGLGQRLASGASFRHLEHRRVIHPLVDLAVQPLLLVRRPGQVRARHAPGRDGPRHVAEHVVLAVGVGETGQQLRVGRDDVEGFHERLLGHLPVHPEHLRHVHPRVPVLQRPPFEERRQFPEEVLERLAVRIGVDEDEPAPGSDPHLGQPEPPGVHLREVPGARDPLEAPVQ